MSDGRIGTIDEASDEADAGHLVVDTGPWIFGQKVLLPAGTVDRVDHQEHVVYVDRTRQQIKDAPPFDPVSADQEYRERVGAYYADSYLPSRCHPAGNLRRWSGRATAHRRRSTWSTASPSVPCPRSRPAPAMAVSNFCTSSVPVVCGFAPARDGGRLAESIPLTEQG